MKPTESRGETKTVMELKSKLIKRLTLSVLN
jgi:hypothetical protein